MNAIVEIEQSLVHEIMKYKDDNGIATMKEALSDLVRSGLQRVADRDPHTVWQVAKYDIKRMAAGTEFSVHDLAKHDSPNMRKYLGRRLAEKVKESDEFVFLRKTQQGLTIYMRTEIKDAPKFP